MYTINSVFLSLQFTSAFESNVLKKISALIIF